jgi:O-antigen ligase
MLKEERHIFWATSAALIGAAMPLILIGRAVSAGALILGIIIGLIATRGTSLRSTMETLRQSQLCRIIAIMFVAFAASIPLAVDPAHAGKHMLQILGMGFASFLLYTAMREMPRRYVTTVIQFLGVTTVCMAVLAGLDAFLADERLSAALHGRKWQSLHRLNYMSSVLAVLLPFLWAWLLRRHRDGATLAKWFALPVILGTFLIIFVCGGRAGWVGATAAAFFFLWHASMHHNLVIHRKHWFLGALVVFLGPVAYGAVRGFGAMWDRLGFGEALGLGSGRLEIWSFAIKHFGDNPITGIGLGNFRKLPIPPEGIVSNAHPHNFVIQIYLETGMLGALASAAFVFYILRLFKHYAEGHLYGLAAYASLIAFFVASLANTSIFQPWWLTFMVFAAVLGNRAGWTGKPYDK